MANNTRTARRRLCVEWCAVLWLWCAVRCYAMYVTVGAVVNVRFALTLERSCYCTVEWWTQPRIIVFTKNHLFSVHCVLSALLCLSTRCMNRRRPHSQNILAKYSLWHFSIVHASVDVFAITCRQTHNQPVRPLQHSRIECSRREMQFKHTPHTTRRTDTLLKINWRRRMYNFCAIVKLLNWILLVFVSRAT